MASAAAKATAVRRPNAVKSRTSSPSGFWDRLSDVFRPANSSTAIPVLKTVPVEHPAIAPLSHAEDGENPRQIVFTLSLIALSAKLMKVDGPASKEEYFAFRRLFPMPRITSARMQELFTAAYRDRSEASFYARRIAELYRDEPALLEEVLRRWLKVAGSDGVIRAPEILLLQGIAREFGLAGEVLPRLFEEYLLGGAQTPYAILGITRDASDAEVKKAYRQQLRDYHPDGIVAAGLGKPYVEIANRKVMIIGEAYKMICRKRGLR